MAPIVRYRKWRRPSDVAPFPKVWHTFAASSHNGRRISIRDISPDEHNEVWEMYKKHVFWDNEELCGQLNVNVDADSMASRKLIFDHIVSQHVSVVAVLNGQGDSPPTIVGCSLLEVTSASDPPLPRLPGKANEKMDRVLRLVEVDLFKKLETEYLLTGYGVAVKREYRGLHVVEELFRNMELVSRTFRLLGTRLALTSPASQRLCAHLGYTKFNEMKLIDSKDESGQDLFPTASPTRTIWYGYLDCS